VNEISEILTRCQQLGIRLSLGLRVQGWSKAPSDLQDAIRLHKGELMRLQSDKDGFSAAGASPKTTPWGIPIADGCDPNDPVFRRHPAECDCYRHGTLHCGVPCVWAWPPEARPGDKAWRIEEV
jgi:hypothetical protein